MATYLKIAFAFDRFLRSLDLSGLSSWQIKLINLIRSNFDKIADAGTAGGKRAKIINDLIQKHGKTMSGELNISKGEAVDTYFPILKLSSLEVENFRGFSEKRAFNFEKQYTFIYGPNGSGKSSFCEALEYSMLGYVSEAEAKRMNLTKYILNMVTGKSSDPVLTGKDLSNKVVKISVSPDDYHFCFIEKNRIDGFARITSKTPGDQGELLASLFGLDEFNNFIANFTSNIENYIDIEGRKAKELKTKKLEIEKEIQIAKEFKEKLSGLDQEKKKLIEENKLAQSFEELDIVIHGDENTTGKIAAADNRLQAPLKQKYEMKRSQDTINKVVELTTEIEKYQKLKEQYDKEKDGINFRKVYQLVIDLEEVSKDKCPVCETPIYGDRVRTVVNPYENARRKLKELEALAQLETKKEQTWNIINDKFLSILSDIRSKMTLAEEFHVDYRISIPPKLLEKSL
ncbi:MAG: AAA family ATPase, partial [Eubacteriales bacterium]